jgi:myo-inositol-1(or 4)-monophosphatase
MHPMLNIAIRAARRAGELIVRSLEQRQDLHIDTKGQNDFVSEVDRQAEAAIIEILRKAYPNHAILAEESGAKTTSSNYQWIIDPLDGTTNFLHGNPQFSVSIALKYKDDLEQAAIYDPLRGELFTASRGQGAFLNDRRVRVSSNTLNNALLGTGFPYRMHHHLDTYLETFKALFTLVSGVRRAGSVALDLSYVASGRLDGFWEIGLQEWDIAAGALIVQEAGGLISDFSGGNDYFNTGNIIAGNPKVHKGILQTIQPHLSVELQK